MGLLRVRTHHHMHAPPPLQGTLSLYQTDPNPLPYFETNAHHPNKFIFLAGLTDTIGVVPYLPRLAEVLDKLQYSLVQPIKGSDMGGFGLSSLEGDAQETAQLIEHLTTRAQHPRKGRLVVMGHSTGCQDVVHLLSKERSLSRNGGNPKIHVDGGILQAPASDYDYFQANKTEQDAQLLALSEKMIAEQRGDALARGGQAGVVALLARALRAGVLRLVQPGAQVGEFIRGCHCFPSTRSCACPRCPPRAHPPQRDGRRAGAR